MFRHWGAETCTRFLFFFTFLPCILIFSRLLFVQLNVQLDCSRKLLKLILKFALKCSYMFRLNKPTSGSLLSFFAKIMIIKMVFKNVVMNQFGLVAAHLSIPYWCVYSAQCSLTLHCALYTQSHSALCTVHTVSLCAVHCTHSLTLRCALYTQSHSALCTVHTPIRTG